MPGLPGGTSGKEPACYAGYGRDAGLSPGWEDPLEEGMAAHSSVPACRVPWTGGLVGCRLRGPTELDMTEAT